MNWDEFNAKIDKVKAVNSETGPVLEALIKEFGSLDHLALAILQYKLHDTIKYTSISTSLGDAEEAVRYGMASGVQAVFEQFQNRYKKLYKLT